MSRALLKDSAATSVQGFAEMLQPVRTVMAPQKKMSPQEKLREEARSAGFSEGLSQGLLVGQQQGRQEALEEGREATRREIERIAAELDRLGEQMYLAVGTWMKQAEEALAMLSLEVAEKIVGGELKTSEEAALNIAKEAIAEITHASSARIRISPFHSGVLESYRSELMSLAPSLKSIEIVADASIGGGCVVETEGGAIDAIVHSKIRRLYGTLTEAA